MGILEFRQWAFVPSMPGVIVSNDGRVSRVWPEQWWREPFDYSIYQETNGYIRTRIDGRLIGVHRLACEAFHGPAPSAKHQAAHGDGIRSNNRRENLRWATRRENYRDQISHGTSKRGEGNHMARLTREQVEEIRRRFDLLPRSSGGKRARKGSLTALAAEFGVAPSCIKAIASRKLWSHL